MSAVLNSPRRSTADAAEERRRRWEEDGFLVVRGLFDAAETAALRAEADELQRRADLIDKYNLRCRFRDHVETGACQFETFDPVIDLAPVCRRIALSPQILELLATLYGQPARLFKDKLIFKVPGTPGYPPHQDWIAWPDFPRSFLTVLVPIDAADRSNGCTEAYPGLHRAGALTPEDGEFHELTADLLAGVEPVPLELEPGDVAVFDGFTPHFSEPNRTDGCRRQLYLSYNAEGDGGDQRAAHYETFRRYLRRRYAEHGVTDTYFA